MLVYEQEKTAELMSSIKSLKDTINNLASTINDLKTTIDSLKTSSMYNMPLSNNWSWQYYNVKTYTLGAGEEYELVELTDFKGWVWYGIAMFSSKNCGFRLRLETPVGDVFDISYSTEEVYEFGLDIPTPHWWVPKYDEANDIYSLAYTPNFPGSPFHKVLVKLVNKGTTSATVYDANIALIKVWENGNP